MLQSTTTESATTRSGMVSQSMFITQLDYASLASCFRRSRPKITLKVALLER